MTLQRFSAILAIFSILAFSVTPAWGVSKEIVELQTQVQQLQQQMTSMQRSFDERMGSMKTLVEQDTDAVNKATAAVAALQSSIQKQQGDSSGKVDQVSGQLQSLNDTMDELKVRLAKVSKQLEDMQASQQTLAAQQSQQTAAQQAMAQAPPPDVLYNNALRDYNGGKNDLATQEFFDYIKFYPNTDLAGNSYFYIGELQFRAGAYAAAIPNYEQVLQNFPSGNKAASAELKKGFALLESGKTDEGKAELQKLIQRYPRSNEALQARERLRRPGTASKE
jgi:tol-pal system protein YbgF